MSAEKDPFAQFLKHFDAGSTLFEEGDDGEELYIVRSGKVAIKKKVPHGEVTLAILEKGDFFGEMAMLEHIPRTAGAEMAEAGKLIVINSEVFGDMIKANPEIAVRMLRKYSLRLRETTKQIEELASEGRGERVRGRGARGGGLGGRHRPAPGREAGQPVAARSRPRPWRTSSRRPAATSSRSSRATPSSVATTR